MKGIMRKRWLGYLLLGLLALGDGLAGLIAGSPAAVEAARPQVPDVTINEFPMPTGSSQPLGITAGPDGNLWFTENTGNKIGRITPTGTVHEFPVPTSGSNPWGI